MAAMHASASDELRQLSNEDYTVGWICALTTEYVAAQVFLDEKHAPPTFVHTHDNNHYTLGCIGKHNVAIAVLPGGEYGTTSAATVARDMLHTFSNVRVGLMVGIGGGAPSPNNDIRLGDVVVSMPQNGLGGVFQYDFGKTIQEQPFQTTRFLAPPPQVLLTAISGLKAAYTINGHSIQEDIRTCLERKKRLKKQFARPDSATDRLFSSQAIHLAGQDSCIGCRTDEKSIISRRAREEEEDDPVIHYGLIASANQLMKDAKVRDQYALAKNILCFEMEAGGLTNHFPCIVVRGICDYSDTHKNKEWQGYAAMTAAAYAKDLLKMINPTKLEAERKIKDVVENANEYTDQVLSVTQSIKEGVESIEASVRVGKIAEWLSPPDPSTNLNKAREICQDGTGHWLLESKQYQSWKTTQASFLWLYGMPGCGKTILSSVVITDLQQQSTSSQALLYFYFTFNDKSKQSTGNAIRSLIYQLYHKQADTRGVLDQIYASTKEQPSIEKLKTTFQAMVEKCGDVWIILDALDECETRAQHSVDGITLWIKSIPSSTNARLLVTSRPEQDIEANIQAWAGKDQIISLQSDLVADDISAYIHTKVNQMSRWQKRPATQQLIMTTLKDKAHGMFRWVACQFDTLEKCLSPEEIHSALAGLPLSLDKTYERILKSLPPEYKSKTFRLLQLLTYSESPLSLEEAVDALATEPGSSRPFDPEYRMPIPEEITRYCSSLVSLTKTKYGKTELQLAHFSVQEYLRSDRLGAAEKEYFSQQAAAEAIVNLCLSYLLALELPLLLRKKAEQNPSTEPSLQPWRGIDYLKTSYGMNMDLTEELDDSLSQTIYEYPFAYFAARYWYTYAYILESSACGVLELVQKYYSNQRAFTLGYLLAAPDRDEFHEETYTTASPLYYASYVGLEHSVSMLLKMNAGVNQSCGYWSSSALHVASLRGHTAIVRLLIQHGADVNKEGYGKYCNALQAAAAHGNEAIVQMLIQQGADVNVVGVIPGYQNKSALLLAAEHGHESIVQMLIQSGADVNQNIVEAGKKRIPGPIPFGNAVQAASYGGHLGIVEMLLQNGADLNGREGAHASALTAASDGGHLRMVELLLQNGADRNAPGQYTDALRTASGRGHQDVVKILIQNGADVNAQDERHDTALQAASRGGHQEVVKILIQNGANVNVRGGYFGTALGAASHYRHKDVEKILIQNGAEWR